jgi:hypothetical protein
MEETKTKADEVQTICRESEA